MRVTDASTCFGRAAGRAAELGLPALLGELRRHRIARAWAYSRRGVANFAPAGNDETLAAARAHPELVPVATIDPRRYHDQRAEIARCLQAGVRVFRVFPAEQRWRYDSVPFVTLVEQLADLAPRAGLPGAVLVCSADGWGAASAIGRLTAGASLAVVLADLHYTNLAEGIAALQRWPHLFALTSRLGSTGAIETLVREVGAQRLLFGSEAPERPLACALDAVRFAEIADAEKAAVLAGNAERLVPSAPLSREEPGEPSDATALAARGGEWVWEIGGRGLPGPIMDVHAHLGRLSVPISDGGVAALEARCRKHDIRAVVVSSIAAITYDLTAGNRELAEQIAGHPWISGYVVVDPNDLAESVANLDRYYPQPNFVGAKIHCQYARTPTASPRIAALFAELARRAQQARVVKIHNAGDDWDRALVALARAHPELNVIIAHAGLGAPAVEAIDAAAAAENVYLEFSSTSPVRGIVRRAIERAGVHKVLFGSDQLLIDPGYVLGAYRDADLTPEEWEQIAWRNPRRVFGLP